MKFFVVDAFTQNMFSGNPAGVCILEKPLDKQTMQCIASTTISAYRKLSFSI